MTFGLRLVNAEKVQRRLQPSTIAGPLRQLLTAASLTAEAAAIRQAPRWKGHLKRDISSSVSPLQARVFTKREQVYYRVMEFGRRPGAKMPPPNSLRAWAASKGFTGSLFVLARSIARRGIKGRFFFKAGREAAQRVMPQLLNRMAQQLGLNYGRP